MKYLFRLIIVLVLPAKAIPAQNLYDEPHSREFASYLYKSGQYMLASIELERLLFMQPGNDSLKERLVRSYSLDHTHDVALRRLRSFGTDPASLPAPLAELYVYNLLSGNRFDSSRAFLAESRTLQTERKLYYKTYSFLLNNQFRYAQEVLAGEVDVGAFPERAALQSLTLEGMQLRKKSPFLAAALSSVVPGSGKFYTRDWKDGIIGLLTVGVMGFQAYRGFEKKGVESVYGWVFGSLAAGFYIGNIYGAAKSAQRYNKRQSERLEARIRHAFYLRP